MSLQRACRAAVGKPAVGRGRGAGHSLGGLRQARGASHRSLSPTLTQQGLDGGTALLEAVAGVRGGEEDCGWKSAGWGVQPEAHGSQQRLPAGDAAHFVLYTLLGGVHGIVLPTVDALQGLLHLQEDERVRPP